MASLYRYRYLMIKEVRRVIACRRQLCCGFNCQDTERGERPPFQKGPDPDKAKNVPFFKNIYDTGNIDNFFSFLKASPSSKSTVQSKYIFKNRKRISSNPTNTIQGQFTFTACLLYQSRNLPSSVNLSSKTDNLFTATNLTNR